MCGCIPKQQRFVKPYTVIVQPGDDEKTITSSFGVCPCRAHELVGANLDQPLADVGTGQVYKRFAGLVAGTKLRVPASWKDPASYTVDGRVGALPGKIPAAALPSAGTTSDWKVESDGKANTRPSGGSKLRSPSATEAPSFSAGQQDALANFISQIGVLYSNMNVPGTVAAMPGFPGYLPGSDINDLYAVVWSWYPYLQQNTIKPTNTKTPAWPLQIDPMDPGKAFTSLTNLLYSAAGFLKATGIPDGTDVRIQNIPWDRFDWAAPLWGQVKAAANVAGIGQSDMWKRVDALAESVLGQTHTTQAIPAAGMGGTAPNFGPTQNWSSLVGTTPIGDTDWNDNITEFLSDAKVQACITANPDRLVAMLACTAAFETGGLAHFREVLCSGKPANPCEAPAPELPVGDRHDEITVDDKKDGTDQVNVVDTGKKDNTALYVGAAAVGLLVGGLALWAAGGKD